jgi:hypothetical protein
MPNWCTTQVSVIGDKDAIVEFIDRASAGYMVKPSSAMQAKTLHLQQISPEVQYAGSLSFGAITGVPDDYGSNWRSHADRLWGCKWDVVVDETPESILETVDLWGSARFTMRTPWSFPAYGVQAWAQAFPHLIFTFRATEESNAFALASVAHGPRYFEQPIEMDELLWDLEEPEDDDDWSSYIDQVDDRITSALNKELDFLLAEVDVNPNAIVGEDL